MKTWFTNGAPKLGTVLTIPNLVIAELVRAAKFDWIWIDAEHGGFDEQSAANFCAVNIQGPKTLVRIPDKSPTTLKRFLDIGSDGLIIPQVNSVEEISEIMRWSLYPPQGERSVGVARAQGYGGNFANYIREKQFGIVIQIETASGVHNLDHILRDGRVDGVLIGPYDLSGSLGLLGQVSSTVVQKCIADILSACKRASVPCGIFAGNSDSAGIYLKQGFDFVGIGVDAALMLDMFKSLLATLRPATHIDS